MKTIVTSLEKLETFRRPTYGGHVLGGVYSITTKQEGIENIYEVTAVIRGMETGNIYLNAIEVKAETNNESTLATESIIDLFDDYIN